LRTIRSYFNTKKAGFHNQGLLTKCSMTRSVVLTTTTDVYVDS